MNVIITFYYLNKNLFSEILPILIETFENADYLIETYGLNNTTPSLPHSFSLKLQGSNKKEFKSFIIDMDNTLTDNTLNPSTLKINLLNNNLHYWSIAGSLVKSFPDASPAFFTGYLTDKNKKDELLLFNSSKPLSSLMKLHQI
ncbi:hypothetical protein FHQ18_06020 [Deferribacter autotrophicus]|uniref:Uncharacterized protein n=1 Tax=Deferribacter autotrophicus TaxID=500465 RepID=A0A5A8F356_9BACT|nr:hypothetical protein [Deferribacter autotrophicus]KAA0257946.1 hypothetical protein FHQ18_06020 [Deferribacter autotrophicus]